MPYVVIAPEKDADIGKSDKLFVYANPDVLSRAIETIEALGPTVLDFDDGGDQSVDNFLDDFKTFDDELENSQKEVNNNSSNINVNLGWF
jgi:hypothetical protein